MALIGKALHDITKADLSLLYIEGEVEGKTLEFKFCLPGNSDDEKKEFLADVSSFANASGGFIILGMQEEDGKATELPGIAIADPDAEILRLESIIRNGCQPRIPGLVMRCVKLENETYALIISIPQSWIGPHMVTYKNWSRFFSRNSAGKYQLDVQEIRQSILALDTLVSRIRNFHLDRLAKVIAGETPVQLQNGAKVVMHLIPIASFQANTQVELKNAGEKYRDLETLFGPPHLLRYNLDGLLTWKTTTNDFPISYTQLFRNGIIEAVDGFMLKVREDGRRFIPSTYFEQTMMNTSGKLLGFQKQVGITPPTIIFVSLSGVKGYSLALKNSLKEIYWMREQVDQIDRDILILPDISLQSYQDVNPGNLFRNLFNAVWNATGWPECLDYDINGNWIEV